MPRHNWRDGTWVHNFRVRLIVPGSPKDGYTVCREETDGTLGKPLGVASTKEMAVQMAEEMHAQWLEHGSRPNWSAQIGKERDKGRARKGEKRSRFVGNAERADAWAREHDAQ